MNVRRIVLNIATDNVALAATFYQDVLGLDVLMDQGWIQTFGNDTPAVPQISFASEGGSGTVVPDLSVEVDDIEHVRRKCLEHNFAIEYGPVDEPWGVRRFYVRDPFGRVVNIVAHL